MLRVINAIRQLKHDISVSSTYQEQMKQIHLLLKNDKTGLVNTTLDFMIHTATVPMQIETKNPTLDKLLQTWQKYLLNNKLNIDIPNGLRELSTEYYRERWTSSLIVTNIVWEKIEDWILPTKIWFADGSAINIENEKPSNLTTRNYYLGQKDKVNIIKSTDNKSIIIRRPYNAWYENCVTPWLVKRGVLFNALLKNVIVDKQADVITQIIPYLLLLRSGSDKLAEINALATKEEMLALKDSIIKSVKENDFSGDIGKLIATLSYDVNMEHFIPDLKKIFDKGILDSVDKNILAGMGLIELVGFSKTRQEAILNPKVMVEEVKDAVGDWTCIIEEIMFMMIEKNKISHPKLMANNIRVVPGTIRAFMTDEMRTHLRGLYDRGLISKQSTIEDVGEKVFEIEVERRKEETTRGLTETLYPPVVQNQEQNQDETTLPDRTPNSPEAKNFKNAEEEEDIEFIQAPYENVDSLPSQVKVLPMGGQIIWLRVFNSIFEETKDEDRARRSAWNAVKEKFYKDTDGKWKKKK